MYHNCNVEMVLIPLTLVTKSVVSGSHLGTVPWTLEEDPLLRQEWIGLALFADGGERAVSGYDFDVVRQCH